MRVDTSSFEIISEYIRNIFDEGELDEQVVVRKFRTTIRHGTTEGKTQSKSIGGVVSQPCTKSKLIQPDI